MDREFSAPLHHTQFGNHLQHKTRACRVNPDVQKLVQQGYSERQAYRIIAKRNKAKTAEKIVFDYQANTPKGEWV